MAKEKRPKSQVPKRTVGQEIGKSIQSWLDIGGGKPKGRAVTIESTDPRHEGAEEEPELVGFDENDMPIFKQPKTPGKPRVVTSPILPIAGRPDGAGTLGDTEPFSDAQIIMLLGDLWGDKGAIRNARPVLGPGETKGPLINTPLPGRGGPLINKPLGGLPTGPKINVPVGGGLPGRTLLPFTLPDWLAGPRQPLINIPLADRRRLLAQRARQYIA